MAVLGGGVLNNQLSASAAVSLPQRSPAQLLVDVQSANLTGVSGTVVEKADFGLPALPDNLGGTGSSQLNSLISGSHTLRVWYAGPDKTRVELLGVLGESDIIRNGNEAWIWSSATNTATHLALTGQSASSSTGGTTPHTLPRLTATPTSPQQAADEALALLGANTTVSTEPSTQIAGRPAYLLSLAPKDAASLIGKIRVAIDSVTHVPTRVELFPKGATNAAFSIGFSQISFARPDDEQFAFTPPPGAQVTDQTGDLAQMLGSTAQPATAVLGSGWTSVLAARLPQADAPTSSGTRASGGATAGGGVLSAYLGMLRHVQGTWGSGRLLQSRLFSVLFTDDGRVLIGAVGGDQLERAAADPAAQLK